MPKPTLDIVIVDFNAGSTLRRCLRSIEGSLTPEIVLSRVCLVDNASRPSSREMIAGLHLPLHLVTNKKNLGFSKACNQGAAGSQADYLLFLNPDTILGPNSLSAPVVFLEKPEHAKVGICGIQLVDVNGRVHRSCSRFPTPGNYLVNLLRLNRIWPRSFRTQFMEEWDHGQNRRVDQVMGACFLTRRKLFDSLAGFDERFFLYFEEVDYSYRAQKSGWSSFYISGAQAMHVGGGTSAHVLAFRLYHSLKSRILYGHKHFGCFRSKAMLVEVLLLEPAIRAVLAASHKSPYTLGMIRTVFFKLWSEFLGMREPTQSTMAR